MSSRQVSSEASRQFLADCHAALGSDMDADDENGDDFFSGSDYIRVLHPSHLSSVQQRTSYGAPSVPTSRREEIICAISESRSSHVVGIAAINTTTGTAELSRIINDDKYGRLADTLSRMPTLPGCFLTLESISSGTSKSLLAEVLANEYPSIPLIPFERKHWGESEGLRLVDRYALAHQVNEILASLESNFYVTCAFSAAMKYILERLRIAFPVNSIRIKYNPPANAMYLDRSTVTSLELLQTVRPTRSKDSTLFAILDDTRTPEGRRLLRATLLQPSNCRKQIIDRWNAIDELLENQDLLEEITGCLKALRRIDMMTLAMWVARAEKEPRLPLDHNLAFYEGFHQFVWPGHEELTYAEKELNNILMLKHYLGPINTLQGAILSAECKSRVPTGFRDSCSPDRLQALMECIESAVEEDVAYSKAPIDIRNNRLWAIKAPAGSIFETARTLFREKLNDLNTYLESLNREFSEQLGYEAELHLDSDRHYNLRFRWSDIEQLILGAHRASGRYHLPMRLPIAGIETINGCRKKLHYHCQTLKLLEMSITIQRQADIVTTQSDQAVESVKSRLLDHSEILMGISEVIGPLDMVCSFARLSASRNYVRPTLGDFLVHTAVKHPVLAVRNAKFVGNAVYSGDKTFRFHVITGSNMSGKSTYIRAIALTQIMAQMGCFVPAEAATVPVCDALFTRLSTEDKPERNMGAFAVELSEMNVILRQSTEKSLVIIDELGRGTSPTEGQAIAIAMCEKMIRMKCRVFFATHFATIGRLLGDVFPGSVVNSHLTGAYNRAGNAHQVKLPHKLAGGPAADNDYGLHLARRFLPRHVIDNASKAARFLHTVGTKFAAGPMTAKKRQDQLLMQLPDQLKAAARSRMDPAPLASYLEQLRASYVRRLHQIREMVDAEGQGPTNPVKPKKADRSGAEKAKAKSGKNAKAKKKRRKPKVSKAQEPARSIESDRIENPSGPIGDSQGQAGTAAQNDNRPDASGEHQPQTSPKKPLHGPALAAEEAEAMDVDGSEDRGLDGADQPNENKKRNSKNNSRKKGKSASGTGKRRTKKVKKPRKPTFKKPSKKFLKGVSRRGKREEKRVMGKNRYCDGCATLHLPRQRAEDQEAPRPLRGLDLPKPINRQKLIKLWLIRSQRASCRAIEKARRREAKEGAQPGGERADKTRSSRSRRREAEKAYLRDVKRLKKGKAARHHHRESERSRQQQAERGESNREARWAHHHQTKKSKRRSESSHQQEVPQHEYKRHKSHHKDSHGQESGQNQPHSHETGSNSQLADPILRHFYNSQQQSASQAGEPHQSPSRSATRDGLGGSNAYSQEGKREHHSSQGVVEVPQHCQDSEPRQTRSPTPQPDVPRPQSEVATSQSAAPVPETEIPPPRPEVPTPQTNQEVQTQSGGAPQPYQRDSRASRAERRRNRGPRKGSSLRYDISELILRGTERYLDELAEEEKHRQDHEDKPNNLLQDQDELQTTTNQPPFPAQGSQVSAYPENQSLLFGQDITAQPQTRTRTFLEEWEEYERAYRAERAAENERLHFTRPVETENPLQSWPQRRPHVQDPEYSTYGAYGRYDFAVGVGTSQSGQQAGDGISSFDDDWRRQESAEDKEDETSQDSEEPVFVPKLL